MIMTKNLLPLTMLLYVSCNLLIISASLAGASLAEMVFRCPDCTMERQALCPKLTETCAEIVREPGCGCCSVCARPEGEMCGVYTPRCATGLRCYPTPNSELPLEQLVQGQGQCRRKVDTEAATYSQEQREQTSGQCACWKSAFLLSVIIDCLDCSMRGWNNALSWRLSPNLCQSCSAAQSHVILKIVSYHNYSCLFKELLQV